MSTKIYNAYVTHLSLNELLPKFIKITSEIKELCINRFLEDVYELAVYSFDRDHKKKTFEEIKEFHFKDYYKESFINYGLTVLLYPYKDATYMMFFGQVKFLEKFKNKLKLKDFHYQDQTDKPKNISEKNWENRIKIWDKILGGDGYGKPIDHGYQFTFAEKKPCTFYDFLTTRNIKIPSDKKRAENMVRFNKNKEIDPDKIFSSFEKIRKSANFEKLVAEEIKKLPKIC
jgi:hypothetical protein